MVKEFHEKFDCVVNDRPTVPDLATMLLRVDLISEEFDELQEQGFGFVSSKPDLVHIADALGDILYVVYGTAVSCGIDMEPIVAEIHRSNMSKIQPDGTILRREDGKIIKPDTYSPADIKSIIEVQQKPAPSHVRSCNFHSDCDAAPAGSTHCRDEDCEDCFGC